MSSLAAIRLIAAVVFCLSATALSAQVDPVPEQPRQPQFAYTVKFLCGPSVEGFQEGTVRGVYATAINLFNLHPSAAVRFTKSVSRALPFQHPGDGGGPRRDEIGPQQGIGIECDEIRMMLASPMTTEFRTGFLAIRAEGQLEVTAVYSARPADRDVATIDVETIEPRRIEAPSDQPPPDREPEPRADLVVQQIAEISITCGSTISSCVTTARVRIANIGAADAGPFQTRVVFDPDQSVAVMLDQPEGLEAGETHILPVASPPAPFCVDPVCQICATVDALDQVQESDETNNTLCETWDGPIPQ